MSPAPANRSKSPFAHPEGAVAVRLQLERLVNAEVQLPGRLGGARPGRKALTLVDAMVAAPATSTTPTSCARAAPRRCCLSG
jgi:hypothetical protein